MFTPNETKNIPTDEAEDVEEIEEVLFLPTLEEKSRNQSFINFIHLLNQEINEDHLGIKFGTLLVVTSDNIFYIALNLNTITLITKLLSLSGVFKDVLHYSILTSGVLCTTAMDVYASGGTIEEIGRLIRRSNFAPQAFKETVFVISLAGVVSLAGVSGMAALVYNLYKTNIPVAIAFSTITMVVNFLSASFFVKSIFETGKAYRQRERNRSDAKFLFVRQFLLNFRQQLEEIDEDKLIDFKNDLLDFKNLNNPTEDDVFFMVQSLNALVSRAPVNTPSTDNDISTFFLALPFAIITFSLFFCTGKNAIDEAFAEKLSGSLLFMIFSYFSGFCLGTIVGATTTFSAASFFKKVSLSIENSDCTNCFTLKQAQQLGKKIVLLIISLLSSLYTIDLVFNCINERNEIFRKIAYFIVPIPTFMTIMNALSEINSTKMLKNTYAQIGYYCLGKSKNREHLLDNIDSLIEQLNGFSNSDILGIYDMLENTGVRAIGCT